MSIATASRVIPLLDLPRQTAGIRKEIDAAIGRVLDHGKFVLGPEFIS